ncbi:MAG: OmpH family outer membrane protein [Bacteroidales bacterium]|nr:OmpH family outer membrane protein [Bacteroidales bacterium]HOK99025.1 OmpH family outer membrane protein [Bacteroidales bacterium]HPO65852.1 OmpH family outer membrane protein [Bacteroidales bacterium]
MKRSRIITFLLALMLGMGSYAQKFAYIDTEYILNNIPAYKQAQDQLDKLSEGWQREVENMYAEIDKMYRDYQAEKVLLTEEMKKKREEEIMNKEKAAKELQKKYFGQDGALFKKRDELIKPIQDEIYKAVKELATEGGYAIIFDSSAGASILYTDPKLDKSDAVLQKLGYKN